MQVISGDGSQGPSYLEPQNGGEAGPVKLQYIPH